ncbi:MAG: multicopper oxidase family protein [Rhizobiales bacterium]|nr:multicopper oxidase family protein [Hyphomicrobiales bacterium]
MSGRAAKVFTIVGPDGRPGIDTVLGQPFRYLLENASDEDALIHWHGLKPPSELDGVPVLSQAALPDGASFLYDFVNTRSGTHWMHSHVGLQEQRLMAAPLIVRETAEPVFDEREHVVMVHDFTFRDPAEIFAELKSGGGAHAGHTTGGMDNSKMDMSTMDMGGTLNDVAFDAYLANDRTLDDPEVVTVEKGGKVRLRIINAAAASNLWIDLGGIEGELVAVDGNPVHAMPGQRFPLAIAQRADIRLQIPAGGGVFPILFRPEGVARQTGILLASKGAAVSRMASEAEALPGLDLELESRLRPVGSLADEPVTRTETVMLTGGGADYLWGLNGVSSAHQTIFTVRRGERLAVMLHNMTGMAHPMHLHGHYFKVTAIDGRAIDGALRDTVLVPPKTTVTIQFDADNPGTWAFHCHHIYHMNSGMMGAIAYSSTA